MLDITLRSRYEAKAKIKEAIQFLEPDLYIVTRNGAIIKTNKLLLSLSSPLLRNLLNGDVSSSDRIHLPDVSGTGLIHLINVIKNGFTTGLGGGYNVLLLYRIKWINTKYSLCTNIVTLSHWLGGGYNVLLLYRIKWINTKYTNISYHIYVPTYHIF